MKKAGFAALLIVTVLVSLAYACSVPVFRYALERWQPDGYTLVIAHDGDLSEEHQKVIETLRSRSNGDTGLANVFVTTVKSSDTESEILKYLPVNHPPYPAMFLFYPRSYGAPKIVWQAELTKKNADLVVESKLRKEIIDEILRGRTATWVLLESGNAEQDDKAYNTIKETLARAQNEIELPEGVATATGDVTGGPEEQNMPIDPINQLHSAIPLQISFSIIRLPADNKDEELLRAMLVNMEDDLSKYKGKPMAFPVFGRGRSLDPLVGEGINEDNIAGMTYYLCGACSCQIKAQNPGIDLLFDVDWDSWIIPSPIDERELPPLSGIADIIGMNADSDDTPISREVQEAQTDEEQLEAPEKSSLLRRNISIALVLVAVLIIGGTAMLFRKDL